MKKTLLILLSLLLVVSVTFAFAACNPDDPCAAEGHSWDDGTPQTPASCESAGVTVYRCRVCGKTETRSEPAKLGHDYVLDETKGTKGWTWEADYSGATAHFTCSRGDLTATQDVTDDDLQSEVQSDGSTVYTASVTGPDGGVYTDTKTKPADGHRHTKGTKHDAQPATCTQAGVAEYWDCEANDGTKLNAAGEAVTDAQLALAALGHTYTVDGALTWKVSGAYDKAILHLVCSDCADGTDGHTLDVELTAKQTTSDASTCGATGSITYTVSVEDTDNAAAITAAVVAPNKLAQGALGSVAPLTHTDNNAQRGHDWKLAQQGAFDWTGTTKDSASVKVKYVCQTCSKPITITFTDAVGTPTAATCTAAGHVEYTLTKTADQVKSAAQSAQHEGVTLYTTDSFQEITAQTHTADGDPATGHTWQVTAVDWAQEYNADPHATVTVACSVCSETYNGAKEVTFADDTQAATCTQNGSVTYTVTVQVESKPLSFASGVSATSSVYTIPALGHTYTVNGALEWKETSSYTTAILHLVCGVCQDGAGHTLDVELTAKQEPTTASTCGETASVTFTVAVDDPNVRAEIDKAVGTTNRLAPNALQDVAKLEHKAEETQLGHQWKLAKEGAFSWDANAQSASVTVKYVCERESCGKQITLTFTDAQKNSTPATCTAKEQIVYTLTKTADQVKAAAKAAELQDVTIYDADTFEAITNEQSDPVEGDDATGHSWQVTEVVWASKYDDDPHATVTVKCSKCHIEYDEGEPEVTFAENKQDPECEVEGSVTYTVTVKVGGAELGFADGVKSTSDAYTIPQIGHNYKQTWSHNGTQHWYECENNPSHKDSVADHQWKWDPAGDGTHTKKCEICGYIDETDTTCTPDAGDETHDPTHQLAEGWYADGDYHWKKCELCGKEYGKERHDYNEYSSEVCVKCGHVHMDVEVSTGDSDPHHVNSVKEAFDWIAEQADKTKTYTIRLNHNRTSDDAENLTVSEGHKVVLDLESYSLTLNGGKLIVTGEGSSLEVTGTGALNATVYYESGTLKLPENLLDKLKLGEGVKCVGENVHITIGEAALEHKWSQGYSFTDNSGHYQECERCGEQNTLVRHELLQWVSDNETQHHQKCKDCGYTTEPVDHNWKEGEYHADGAKGHYQVCEQCEAHSTTVGHDLTVYVSEGPEKHHQECATCDYATTPVSHDFVYSKNEGADYDYHNVSCENCDYTGTESCVTDNKDVCEKCEKDYRISVTVHFHRGSAWTGSVYVWAWYEGDKSGNCLVDDGKIGSKCLMTSETLQGTTLTDWWTIELKYPRNVTCKILFTSDAGYTHKTTDHEFEPQSELWFTNTGKACTSLAEVEEEENIPAPAKTDWFITGSFNGWGATVTDWEYAFGKMKEEDHYTITLQLPKYSTFKFKINDADDEWKTVVDYTSSTKYSITKDTSVTGNTSYLVYGDFDKNFYVAYDCTLEITYTPSTGKFALKVIKCDDMPSTAQYWEYKFHIFVPTSVGWTKIGTWVWKGAVDNRSTNDPGHEDNVAKFDTSTTTGSWWIYKAKVYNKPYGTTNGQCFLIVNNGAWNNGQSGCDEGHGFNLFEHTYLRANINNKTYPSAADAEKNTNATTW